MTQTKDFAVFDADSHVVEPVEVWEHYLDPEYRTLGRHALWREQGRHDAYLKINGTVFRDTTNPNIPRHAIYEPGMTWDDVGRLDPDTRHAAVAGASDAKARLRDMDNMGIDQSFLYPTWFAEGFHLIEDPDVAWALARAYNDWVRDFCAVNPDRLFAAAMIPLQSIDFTIAELDRISSEPCFRGVFIRPMFLEGRYFTHPYFEPLFGTIEERGLVAAVHPSAGLWNPEWTSHGPFFEKVKDRLEEGFGFSGGPAAGGTSGPEMGFKSGNKLGHPISPILSPWLDNHLFVAAALIGFGAMQRYPNLKVVMPHGKASWMEEVLEKMEASTRTLPLSYHYPIRTDPEVMWDEGHILLGFDAEERLVQQLPEVFSQKVTWGSRYPHHDTTSAWDAIKQLDLAGVDANSQTRMLGGNAAEQFGVEARHLIESSSP
ncbi:amidohydrolase [Myxococcota bacterium]|nr:amidohydrolase [Myxococcota bacterium]